MSSVHAGFGNVGELHRINLDVSADLPETGLPHTEVSGVARMSPVFLTQQDPKTGYDYEGARRDISGITAGTGLRTMYRLNVGNIQVSAGGELLTGYGRIQHQSHNYPIEVDHYILGETSAMFDVRLPNGLSLGVSGGVVGGFPVFLDAGTRYEHALEQYSRNSRAYNDPFTYFFEQNFLPSIMGYIGYDF